MVRRLRRFAILGGLCLALAPLALLSRLCALCGAHRAALRLGARAQRLWGRGVLALLAVEVVLEGERPGASCLVVANHLSYLDIPLLASLFPGRFVAKSEIAGWPFLGTLARSVGTLWVEQQRRRDVVRVDSEMARTLAAGVSVLLFPEGHSTRGLGVDRLHSSLLEVAVRGRIPCLAVAVSYETPDDPWAPAATVCWWGGMGFARHAWDLVGLRSIRARVSIAGAPLVGADRKLLALELHRAIERAFVPVRQEPIAPDYAWPELFAAERGSGGDPGSPPVPSGGR